MVDGAPQTMPSFKLSKSQWSHFELNQGDPQIIWFEGANAATSAEVSAKLDSH